MKWDTIWALGKRTCTDLVTADMTRTANTLLNRVAWLIATGGGTGISPVAPGTVGSAVALIIYYLLPVSGTSFAFFSLILGATVIGIWATGAISTPADPDPGKAVWDEFVGMWITCLLLPKEALWLGTAFLLFRFLDITKPWPARKLESLPGGFGIMFDDVLVAAYGAALLNIVRIGLLKFAGG